MQDVQVINALLNSMFKSFSVMANMEPVAGLTEAKVGNLSMGQVTGIIEMSSEEAKGSMAISFTTPFVVELVKRMLGDDIDDINDTARDLTGEMTNMIAGGAKGILGEKGLDIGMSVPNILTGENHVVEHMNACDTIITPFSVNKSKMFLELNFAK